MKREDMKAAAKFRASCDCGAKSPRFATDTTTGYWMRDHERMHRELQATQPSEPDQGA